MKEENLSSDLPPMPSPPCPPSMISHSTTSSNGSDHDSTQLMGLSYAQLLLPVTATEPLPTPQSIFLAVNCMVLTPQVTATATPSNCRPLLIQELIEQPVPSDPPILASVPMLSIPAAPVHPSAPSNPRKRSRFAPMLSTPAAPVQPSARKRSLLATKAEKKLSFSPYGSNDDAGRSSSNSATVSTSRNAALMSMIAKRLALNAKVRKALNSD